MTKGDPATTPGEAVKTEVGSVFVSNYPPYSFWSADSVPRALEALEAVPRPGAVLGLYLHVPFCRRRCKFCYFKVYTDKNARDVQRYLDAMALETERLASMPAVARRPLEFVYFGGGTPSFIGARQLRSIVERVRAALPWDAVREITFECEPGTLTRPKLEVIREIGVTRLSLGIENFNDAILHENGRAHVSREIERALPWIRDLGFDQLNVDLIAGMVGETEETWKETVARTIETDADCVTIYQMELPFNTVYSRRVLDEGKPVAVADWETKRAWQDYAIEQLQGAGYEVSSAYTMVKRDRAARFLYRDSVWHGCDLLGAGVASFSHVNGVHYQNTASWETYLERCEAGETPVERAFATGPEERVTRELILQLKLGVIDASYFGSKFGVDILELHGPVLERLTKRGMLEVQGRSVRLTRQGLLRVDSLLPEFYASSYRNARYT